MPSSNSECVGRVPIARPSGSQPLRELSTDELARLAQSGDEDAFEKIATELRPRLVAVLEKRMSGHVADAEDVAQEALTRAWQHIARYDKNRSFKAWIYTIAFRRATDHLRSHTRRERHANQLAAFPRVASVTQQQAHDDRETADNVWATARKLLSTSQYSALWLRYAEELPVAEIAVAIGKSKVATRVILHRARTKLQSQLKESPE